MADISLTDYSYFLNHFVELRKALPFEKNTLVGSPKLCACVAACLYPGQRHWDGNSYIQNEVWDTENRIFQGDKTSPCASTALGWDPPPLSWCGTGVLVTILNGQ